MEGGVEKIMANRAEMDREAGNVRVQLSRLLGRLWESISLTLQSGTPADHWERAAQLKLANMQPRPRQAFLLTAVEGFSFEEAAEILETSEAGFAALLDEAGREIGEGMGTGGLIIEDEPPIAMGIEDNVSPLGHPIIGGGPAPKKAGEVPD